MNTHTQISAAACEVAARLEIDTAELAGLCQKASRAGWTTMLDQLSAVLVGAHAQRGARGRVATDAIAAAIFRDGPRRQEEKDLRVRAAVSRCDGRGWQSQYRARTMVRDARGRCCRWEALT